MAISTQLVALIKNIYTLWGLPRLLQPVTYFFLTNLILIPHQGKKKPEKCDGTKRGVRHVACDSDLKLNNKKIT